MIGFFEFLTVTLLGHFIHALEMGITTIMLFVMLAAILILPMFLLHWYFKSKITKDILIIVFSFSLFLSLALAPEFNDYIMPKIGTHK